MIELKDDEILDFLMTSEFENDYKPEEFKYLLVKWRYFYRLLHGVSERFKSDILFEMEKKKEIIDLNEKRINSLLIESSDKQNIIDSMKNRKLTFKERFYGQIILEDKNN